MENEPKTCRGSEISECYRVPKSVHGIITDLTRARNTSICGESKKKHALSPKKQRPQQSLKRMADPPKFESKVSTSDAKVSKAEIKKQEEEKKSVPLPAPVEPPLQGGHYELNARMTRMVETELRDIMIKVWHELPDNPSDHAEALVVEKLRNQAGDDFRNVLGLNITKRLLNVHNPLYVKVQFSGKPEKVHLGEFLKKYNFTAFKRIEKTVNMFAAQVKTITDFDRICSAKDIRCGDIKVSVTPIYKFTKCPPNLVTSFYDQEEDANDEIAETTEKEEKLEEKTEIIPAEKVIAKTENVPTKPKVEDSKSEHVTKAEKVVCKPVENKIVVMKPATGHKPTAEKPASKPAENKAAAKPSIANKAAVNKPAAAASKSTVENKSAVNKPAAENKTAVNKTPVKPAVDKPTVNKPMPEKTTTKPAVQNKIVTNPSIDNKPAATKLAIENKTVVNKTAIVNKPFAANKPAAENRTVAKPAVENNEVKKRQVTTKINDTGKIPGPSSVKTAIKTDEKADKTNKVDDYDELDDHDILALMSEGIVLDECSGSDDE